MLHSEQQNENSKSKFGFISNLLWLCLKWHQRGGGAHPSSVNGGGGHSSLCAERQQIDRFFLQHRHRERLGWLRLPVRARALPTNQLPRHRLTTGRSGNNTAAQRGTCDARRLERRPPTHESTGGGFLIQDSQTHRLSSQSLGFLVSLGLMQRM